MKGYYAFEAQFHSEEKIGSEEAKEKHM